MEWSLFSCSLPFGLEDSAIKTVAMAMADGRGWFKPLNGLGSASATLAGRLRSVFRRLPPRRLLPWLRSLALKLRPDGAVEGGLAERLGCR